ncbi:MAG TPA: SDR family oxidoreductase [Candidatus Acidoferrum sp.]|nr:SDR family oxidoreductase [Candidatus Acidoferrum sp.]
MRRKATLRLTNRTALITGGARGIGLAIAHALASEGCNLILIARNESALKKVSRQLPRTRALACDVRDPRSVDDLFRAIRRRYSQLDILINNAGIAHANLPIERLPYATWKDVLATNLDGMFLVTQASLPLMKRGAVIVNNLSIAATRVFAGNAAYNSSKHAALGFTNTLREELRSKEVRVIGLLPGATHTEIWNTLWPQAPRKKMMTPDTVAKAVLEAILLPANATVEMLQILPTAGTL